MLEIKHLSKIYKSKNMSVNALDDINLTIQDKGMVFILGKSGSGKSTLLNVLGGLDKFDDGEIIICGKSSKDFKQSDFDSYRNTFIGFIFQEYNVMNNFTVQENIALALQLQGKKASQKVIEEILEKVDLKGLGNRKPNELSGGQLQRVAIARALIKNPEIIMADEPTGALDSKTGQQVFETLKKLSKEKLVLIVSHDKEFAKNYADRIIELADGQIISDTSKEHVAPQQLNHGISMVEEEFINISNSQDLTDEDITNIIHQLKQHQGEIMISLNANTNKDIKKTHHIDENGAIEVFHPTADHHLHIKDYTQQSIQFIKSKLPLSSSLKMALSNLKLKPFRLFITIMLSVTSFTLFGLTNTLSQYNKETTAFQSMRDSQVNYISIGKQNFIKYDDNYSYYQDTPLNAQDIEKIKKQYPDLHFLDTFSPNQPNTSLDYSQQLIHGDKMSPEGEYYSTTSSLSGLASLNEQIIKDNNFTLNGQLPQRNDEIVITKQTADTFLKLGFQTIDKKGNIKTYKINNENDLINKKLSFIINGQTKDMKITGILDTHLDLTRYDALKDTHSDNGLSVYYLQAELQTLLGESYHTLGYISQDLFDKCINDTPYYSTDNGEQSFSLLLKDESLSPGYLYNIKDIDKNRIIDFNNNGNIYLNYQTIKNIKINQRTIEDYVLELADPTNQKETLKAIQTVVKKYQKYIIDTPYQLFYSHLFETEDNIISKIAGVYVNLDNPEDQAFALTEDMIKQYKLQPEGYANFILSSMPQDDEILKNMISNVYHDDMPNVNYTLKNPTMPMLTTVNSMIDTLENVFFVVGIGFAVFASVMFCNFIATSIANKKREIGILRAVGARGKDVLRIFLNESLMIAGINWIASVIVCIAGTHFINGYIRDEFGVLVTILNFGPLQIILLLIIAVVVACVSSAIPVFNISHKKPIDAIKDRK